IPCCRRPWRSVRSLPSQCATEAERGCGRSLLHPVLDPKLGRRDVSLRCPCWTLLGVKRTLRALRRHVDLTRLTHRGQSPDRNPPGQQCRGVLFLSFESTGGTGQWIAAHSSPSSALQ